MTMRDLHSNLAAVHAIPAQTINQAGGALQSGAIDLAGFASADVAVHFGAVVELGPSPAAGAKIDVRLEHAADDGTGAPGVFADITDADVIGVSGVSGVVGGITNSTTDDTNVVSVGYVGDRRFLRVTLTPTNLTSGGPAGVLMVKGHPRHAPA